ncbi:hypothetical protein C8T65DRAFT_650767 [Cerioporus squamosus]|nr:hypothetical protein C8T65DRAFT_650767 [Cerioporus squamosus]
MNQTHYNNSPNHPKCETCEIGFASERRYEEHLGNKRTCHVCHVHLEIHENLDMHYRDSQCHPRCSRCGRGFMTTLQYGMHLSECIGTTFAHSSPAAKSNTLSLPTPEESVSGASVSDSALLETEQKEERMESSWATTPRPLHDEATPAPSIDDSDASEYHAGNGGAQRDASPRPLTSVYCRGPATPSLPTDDDILEALDVRYGTEMASHVRHILRTEDVSTEVRPSADGSPLSHPPAGETISSHEDLRSDSSMQQGPLRQTSPSTGLHAGMLEAQSWHCRACLREPSNDTVATFCGHLFCRSCLMQMCRTDMRCSVCGQLFFLKLEL